MMKPLKDPLKADLPENWNTTMVVAPTGEEAGLSEKHGYNYLMRALNDTQKAVNTVNGGFESLGRVAVAQSLEDVESMQENDVLFLPDWL